MIIIYRRVWYNFSSQENRNQFFNLCFDSTFIIHFRTVFNIVTVGFLIFSYGQKVIFDTFTFVFSTYNVASQKHWHKKCKCTDSPEHSLLVYTKSGAQRDSDQNYISSFAGYIRVGVCKIRHVRISSPIDKSALLK